RSAALECASARAIRDPALREVVRRELDGHGVAFQDSDVVLAHLPRDVRGHDVAIRELDAKSRVRQRFHYRTFHLYRFFFGHSVRVDARFGRRIVAYRAQRRQTAGGSRGYERIAVATVRPHGQLQRSGSLGGSQYSSSSARKFARDTLVAPRLATCAEAT